MLRPRCSESDWNSHAASSSDSCLSTVVLRMLHQCPWVPCIQVILFNMSPSAAATTKAHVLRACFFSVNLRGKRHPIFKTQQSGLAGWRKLHYRDINTSAFSELSFLSEPAEHRGSFAKKKCLPFNTCIVSSSKKICASGLEVFF